MSIITHSSLSLATKVLRYRLVKPSNIGVNILNYDTALNANIEENFGRFVGFFVKRANLEPCFILFSRSDPESNIDHVFTFYLRHNYSKIQQSELKLLKAKLPALSKPDLIQFSVINVYSDLPKTCDLSILIQAVEFSIHPNLMTNFVKRHDIRTGQISKLVCFNSNIPVPSCDLTKYGDKTDKIWAYIGTLDLKVLDLNVLKHQSEKIPHDFNILLVVHSGHLIYAINHYPVKSIMLLLPHCNQFGSQQVANEFITDLKSNLDSYNPRYIGATRYYGDSDTKCNSKEILKACIFSNMFGNNLISVIKKSDVDSIIPDDKVGEAVEAMNVNLEESNFQDIEEDSLYLDVESHHSPLDVTVNDDIRITEIGLNDCDGDTEILSVEQSSKSSQSTVISSSQETIILSPLHHYNEVRSQVNFDYFLNSNIPPLPVITTMNNMEGELFKDDDLFLSAAEMIGTLLGKYTRYIVSTHALTTWQSFDENIIFDQEIVDDHHFIVIAVLYKEKEDHELIIVIDAKSKEWIYMSAKNEAVKDSAIFERVESIAKRVYPPLEGMKGWPVMITSNFHEDFPRIHLLMALYQLAKLFKYSIKLPHKLIYRERDFRQYCYELNLELQVKNTKFNMESGMIRPNGNYKPGAILCPITPIEFQRSVVPLDQCPFCLRRGFKRLENHISMEHGGRSELCNTIRHSK